MALKTVKLEAGPASPQAAPTQPALETAAPESAAAAPPKKIDFRRRVLPVVGGVVALAVIAFGGNWFLNGRFEVTTDNALVKSDVTLIASRVEGYVASVAIRQNQRVKAGDLLFTVEQADYKASLAEAEAALAQAEADAATAKARIAAQQAGIAAARSGAATARDRLTQAQADAAQQASDVKRFADLAEKGWYPKAKLEQAEAAEKAARAGAAAQQSQVASANAAINQAQQEFAAATSAAASSDARIAAAKARLEAAQLDLTRTEVRAPIDGVVTNASVVPGVLLKPGQATLAIVPNDAYVIANFKETQIADMKPGQPVRLKVDGQEHLKCSGVVDSIAAASGATFSLIPQDTATGNYTKIVQRVPVKIRIDETCLASGVMRTGISVVPTVITKH
jgi:membrane fusion protein (multidrug efflux system)